MRHYSANVIVVGEICIYVLKVHMPMRCSIIIPLCVCACSETTPRCRMKNHKFRARNENTDCQDIPHQFGMLRRSAAKVMCRQSVHRKSAEPMQLGLAVFLLLRMPLTKNLTSRKLVKCHHMSTNLNCGKTLKEMSSQSCDQRND